MKEHRKSEASHKNKLDFVYKEDKNTDPQLKYLLDED